MKIEVSVPEVIHLFKEIQTQPEQLFDIIRADIRQSVGQYLSEMMQVELTQFLGREPYERTGGESNHRNGSYRRQFTLKGIGSVDVEVPRDRKGNFQTQVIPRSKRYEDQLRQDLSAMFLTRISTRVLAMLSKRLIGRSVSPTEVSSANRELIDAVEQWRNRDLSHERITYIFVDGVNFDMRLGDTVEKVPALSAVRWLENALDACLTFFNCPKEEWISLRTTNIIERLNKEFKRRTKPMEIVAGEHACYTLLAFISFKMELHWRSSPVGKVPKTLPFLKMA